MGHRKDCSYCLFGAGEVTSVRRSVKICGQVSATPFSILIVTQLTASAGICPPSLQELRPGT